MILERARVERVKAPYAWVQCESQAGCQRCAEGRGCGGGIFSGLLRGRLSTVQAVSRHALQVGDLVMIGISESALLGAAILLYILPLAGLLVGALLFRALLPGDGEVMVFLGAVTGFMVSWVAIRHAARHRKWVGLFQPVVVKTLAEGEPCLINRGAKQ